MRFAGLRRSVMDDLRRHWRPLAAGGLGIAISVAALTFFLALGLAVRGVLLGEVFPVDRIEVVRPSTDLDLLALRIELGGDTLDAADLSDLEAMPGIAAVYPKMRLLVPALATGGESLIGAGMQTELVADGVDPALVGDELGDAFHDPTVPSPPVGRPCRGAADCGPGTVCVGASGRGPGQCREPIPAIVSDQMIELYNGAFRRAYRLPKINPDALVGLGVEVTFGASSLRPSRSRVVRERVVLAGFSDAAIPLGVTLPLGFVERLNRELGPAGAADGFHSAVLELEPGADAARVIEAVEARGLEVRDRGALRAAAVTDTLLAVIAVVGLVVLAVAAIHVMHVFALLVMVRRREIGVMRAVGASRGDVVSLLLSEAAAVGLAAGLVGVGAARLVAWVADRALASSVPDFPFKPESFFAFEPWLAAVVVALAAVACVVGAVAPILSATRPDPAEVVSGG